MTSDEIKRIIEDKSREQLESEGFFKSILEPYLREMFVSVPHILIKAEHIEQRAKEIARSKNEPEYINDTFKKEERFTIGHIAEIACEKKLGLPYGSIYDSSIGINRDHHHPDLARVGFRMGCKSSQIHNAPMISPNLDYPNIVCLVNKLGSVALVAVLGVANSDLVKKYGSFSLLRIAEKRDKVGFFGHDHLESLPRLENSPSQDAHVQL